MSQLMLSLADTVAAELAKLGRETSRSLEEVAQDVLRRMIALRRVEALRREIRSSLGADSPATEDEVFELIS